MASLDAVSPSRAHLLDLGLAAANSKNFVLSAAAAASIMESGVEGTQLALAVELFVLVGSASVVGAVVVLLGGGARGASTLEGVQEYMVANSAVITMFVLDRAPWFSPSPALSLWIGSPPSSETRVG